MLIAKSKKTDFKYLHYKYGNIIQIWRVNIFYAYDVEDE